ncbi:MAG: hypothetical protein WAX80_02190 [Minisyncoccia bacterium]
MASRIVYRDSNVQVSGDVRGGCTTLEVQDGAGLQIKLVCREGQFKIVPWNGQMILGKAHYGDPAVVVEPTKK